MSEKMISGVIQTAEKSVVFSAREDSFEFSFMTDSMYSLSTRNIPTRIPATNGFIYGKTHGNQNIAIYIGNTPFEILCTGNINTSAYVTSTFNDSIVEYKAIRFVGGSLNDVFRINGMNISYEDERKIVEYIDDSISHTVTTSKYNMEIVIRSSTYEHRSVHGSSICNAEVELTLTFDEPQPLIELFDHYNRIKDLLFFMTFRNSVGFDKIYLLKEHSELGCLTKSAEVFIRNDNTIETRDRHYNICFEDLGDALPRLIKLLYDVEDRKQGLSFGFIPLDDRDVNLMTNTKIRSICSALECELSYIKDIDAINNEELNQLIATVRETIKTFRKSHELSNDTYNLIFSSVAYWSFPLAEKLCALYHKYEREISILNHSRITITDKLIREFVKYRNDITHGKHRIPDIGIAVTAHYMCGVVYCCILERIGMDRNQIKSLCEEKILS